MKYGLIALPILAALAGCDAAKESSAGAGAPLVEVALLNEISGPGGFVHFRETKGQCHYLGELTSEGYAAIAKMQCQDGTQAMVAKDVQSYVLFDAAPVKAGMTFTLHDGVAPVVNSENEGVLVALANFLGSISQKFESQN